ncbi:MAG: GNVR domain-containing protein, partial [Rhodocyclaceae bacterium]
CWTICPTAVPTWPIASAESSASAPWSKLPTCWRQRGGEITAPTKPSKPKKALVLALAAVLGMMGGVMLAFVAEFVAKAKANAAGKA